MILLVVSKLESDGEKRTVTSSWVPWIRILSSDFFSATWSESKCGRTMQFHLAPKHTSAFATRLVNDIGLLMNRNPATRYMSIKISQVGILLPMLELAPDAFFMYMGQLIF